MLIFADSGILLRFMERTDPQHGTIRQAVRTLVGRGDEMVTAAQNLAEFWNVCTRPATARGGLGLPIAEADRRLRVLERLFAILSDLPTAYGIWRNLIVSHAVQGKQVHDTRLAALMLAHGITHILTLNGADFARFPTITVLDPATFAPSATVASVSPITPPPTTP